MTRVLLVDDQEMIRSGLAMLINSEPDLEVVGEAESAQTAIDAVRLQEPDVVVMDVRLGPTESGVAAAAAILGDEGFAGSVLMLTTFDDDEAVAAAFQAGASGFLLKQSESDELLRAIRILGDGGVAVDQAIVRRLMTSYPGDVVDKASNQTATASPLDVLTAREREVLDLIAAGMSNAEIAQELVLSLPTVKTHVRNILLKLDARDRLQAAMLARG